MLFLVVFRSFPNPPPDVFKVCLIPVVRFALRVTQWSQTSRPQIGDEKHTLNKLSRKVGVHPTISFSRSKEM